MRTLHLLLACAVLSTFGGSDSLAKKDPDHLLTCKKLDYIMSHHSGGSILPFCNPAGVMCKALVMAQERPKKDVLRNEVESRLVKDLRYELDICEIALRKINPDYLTERESAN